MLHVQLFFVQCFAVLSSIDQRSSSITDTMNHRFKLPRHMMIRPFLYLAISLLLPTSVLLAQPGSVDPTFDPGEGPNARVFVTTVPVSYTHLRAHETVLDLVCRLLLEKKKKKQQHT